MLNLEFLGSTFQRCFASKSFITSRAFVGFFSRVHLLMVLQGRGWYKLFVTGCALVFFGWQVDFPHVSSQVTSCPICLAACTAWVCRQRGMGQLVLHQGLLNLERLLANPAAEILWYVSQGINIEISFVTNGVSKFTRVIYRFIFSNMISQVFPQIELLDERLVTSLALMGMV